MNNFIQITHFELQFWFKFSPAHDEWEAVSIPQKEAPQIPGHLNRYSETYNRQPQHPS